MLVGERVTPEQERKLHDQASDSVRELSDYELQEMYLNAVAGIQFYHRLMGSVALSDELGITLSVMRAELDERNLLRTH